MTEAAHRVVHYRQRIRSDDFNRQVQLAGRHVNEGLFAIVASDRAESGVLRGMNVTVDAGDREATVDIGIGLQYSDFELYPESQYRWVEVREPTTVGIPAATGYARWDVVEIGFGDEVTSTATVDIWDPSVPPEGAFVPGSRDVERQAAPEIRVRAGPENPGNPPNFPDGDTDTEGWMPLAYIYVDASGVVQDGIAGIVQCRPLLQPIGAMSPSEIHAGGISASEGDGLVWVQGGGIATITGEAIGPDVRIYPCKGRFRDGRVCFSTGLGSIADPTDEDVWDEGDMPGSPQAAYAYAFRAPYPSGYAAMADREFIVGSGVRQHFACVHNDNDRQFNCGVVLSPIAPESSDWESSCQGMPNAPIEITDWPFRDGTTMAALDQQDCVYLGGFSWGGGLDRPHDQGYNGGGSVSLQEIHVGHDILDMGSEGVTHQFDIRNYNGPLAGIHQGHIPDCATRFRCVLSYDADSPTGAEDNYVRFKDDEMFQFGGSVIDTKGIEILQESGDQAINMHGFPIELVVERLGATSVSVEYSRDEDEVNEILLVVVGYIDKILASR